MEPIVVYSPFGILPFEPFNSLECFTIKRLEQAQTRRRLGRIKGLKREESYPGLTSAPSSVIDLKGNYLLCTQYDVQCTRVLNQPKLFKSDDSMPSVEF